MEELNTKLRTIRELLIEYADEKLRKDYELDNQDLGDIFGISRQAVYQILIRQRAKKIPK